MTEKKKPRIHWNLGTVVFLVIAVYLTVCVIRYMGKEKLAIYEVSASDISEDIEGTGVIIREEMLMKTEQTGYINYYLQDGSNVAQNGAVYTIDRDGKIQSYLNTLMKEKNKISMEEKNQIFEDLKNLSESFSDNDFSEIYEAKNSISHHLMSYSDTILADHKEELEKKYGKDAYVEVCAPSAGIVAFSSDGLENLKLSNLSDDVFDNRKRMTNLRVTEKRKAGSPVYRLVKSQEWYVALKLSEDDYSRMERLSEEKSTVKVTFGKDNLSTRVPFACKTVQKKHYVVLTMKDYMQRYINQRYLTVKLQLSYTKGLKIPSSSIVEKEVFQIPKQMLAQGSNGSGNKQVNVMTINKKGEKKLHQETVKVYKTDEKNAYVSSSELSVGDILANLEKTERFELAKTTTIQGVYMVNRGYAEFKRIEVKERNEDYCIISADESEVVLYDRIILDSNTIKENEIIY